MIIAWHPWFRQSRGASRHPRPGDDLHCRAVSGKAWKRAHRSQSTLDAVQKRDPFRSDRGVLGQLAPPHSEQKKPTAPAMRDRMLAYRRSLTPDGGADDFEQPAHAGSACRHRRQIDVGPFGNHPESRQRIAAGRLLGGFTDLGANVFEGENAFGAKRISAGSGMIKVHRGRSGWTQVPS